MKNKLKNKGIRIRANGIKALKFSSKVKELVIQYKPLKIKPNPNDDPNINRFFFKRFFSISAF